MQASISEDLLRRQGVRSRPGHRFRSPRSDDLHDSVREGFGALRAAMVERPLPRFVEREFEILDWE